MDENPEEAVDTVEENEDDEKEGETEEVEVKKVNDKEKVTKNK